MSGPGIRYDLQIKYGTEYGDEEESAVLAVLRQGAPTSGDECLQFEKEFAAYCGTAHARAVTNGTAALFLSLIGAGVGPGDQVLTTPVTWIATAAAGVTLGADVDFVDIDPETGNLDPALLEAKITPRTKAVLPVHLYGQCCDMEPILEVARAKGIAVIERTPAMRSAPSIAGVRPAAWD
jgi:dTDP-4-amino-4,6-dideoxygalactose transaminase